MAISLQALIDDPSLLARIGMPGRECSGCGNPIRHFLTGANKVGSDLLCDDCYYGEVGRELGQHPVCTLRVRRG